MLVHFTEAIQHGAEMVRADRQHGRETNGRTHGVAPADPIPKSEHIGRVDAELRHLRGIGRDGDEMSGNGGFLAFQAGQQPVTRGMRVGHGLERGEGLRGNDEQRLRGIETQHRFGEVRAIDIGDEAEGHGALAVVLERFVGHDGAEIGAADADIDHAADAFAGVSLPLAAAHAVGEIAHLVEHGMDLRHDVLAIDHDRGPSRRPQGDMQHGAILRHIDLLAGKHRVDPSAQAALLGKLTE